MSEELLARFAAGPALIEDALEHAADAMERGDGDGWSIREILVHLSDAEILRAVRLRLILAQPGVELPVFDQDTWRATLAYGERDPGIAFSVYASLVGASAEMVAALGDGAWDMAGLHPEEGALSVRELITRGANHAQEHAAQIRAIVG
jgi:hypothetical protein